ncbi:unnamed protein product [Hymenolepis diminuta]|uniref:Uncharacterized protein n=1 Tax=Hymenolepis diminuta TaxID=6216 RepID=A0A564YWN2_HYMDI|nr:unnamed protein product [Hymenolepis diminuta]
MTSFCVKYLHLATPLLINALFKFVLHDEIIELNYSETAAIIKEVFGWNFSLFNQLIVVIEHDGNLYEFSGVVNFHCFNFSFGTLTEEQFRSLIFISGFQMKIRLPLRTYLLKIKEEIPNMKL